MGDTYTLVYDAWNRLISVSDGDTLVATYMYDARNHRIKKTVGNTVTLSYFNQNWQEVESVTAGVTTTYVYGLRYIDDIVCRMKNTEVLYALQDPNWNVVALVTPSGTVAERMTYDSFGKPTFRAADFTAKTTSSYNWTKTFTGQVYDSETGLMLYRNRYYHPGLGRFITRDPIGYEGDSANLYRYVIGNPLIWCDAYGLKWSVPDFFAWYYFGRGTTVTLDFIGLMYEYREATLKDRMMQIKQHVANSGQLQLDCSNEYQVISSNRIKIQTAVGGGITDPLTVLGNSSYEANYVCNVLLTCDCCDGKIEPVSYKVGCRVSFAFHDRFSNPLDKGGYFNQEHDWIGSVPYNIVESWKDIFDWSVKLRQCN